MSDNKPEEQRDKTFELCEVAFEASRTMRPNFDMITYQSLGIREKEKYILETQAVAAEAVRRAEIVKKQELAKQAELIRVLVEALKTCVEMPYPDPDYGGFKYDYDFDSEMVKEALRKAEGVL